jgi:hypothetical protein
MKKKHLIIENAQKELIRKQEEMEQRVNPRGRLKEPWKVRDEVCLRAKAQFNYGSPKLAPRLSGPFKIVEIKSLV